MAPRSTPTLVNDGSEAAAPPARRTWSSAFQRFAPGRFPIVEPVGLAVHDWSRPAAGHPRMFDQDFLEWFTCSNPRALAAAYIPIGAALIWLGLRSGLTPLASAGWFVGGLLLWTLLEYLIHRFSFHLSPRNRAEVIFCYLIHGVHHAYPEDERRWVMPLTVSLPVSFGIFLALHVVLGTPAKPCVAGVLIGYLAYDTLHYAIHRGPLGGLLGGRLGAYLRRHHLQHHYATPDIRFGVSTPIWDVIFRTNR